MKRIHRLMNKRPILMGSLLSGVITVIGDIGSQRIERIYDSEDHINDLHMAPQQIELDAFDASVKESSLENPWLRTGSMFFWGYMISFPLMYWYKRLDIWFPIAKGDSRLFEFRQVLGKLATHQVFVPIMLNIGFFTYVQSLDHHFRPHLAHAEENSLSLKEKVLAKLNQDLLNTMIRSLQLWVPANLMNFYLVPLPYRILVANLVGAVWIMYLSYVAHLKVETHDQSVQL